MLCAVSAGRSTPKYSYFAFLLTCTFIFGYLAGAYIASNSASHYSLLMRSATALPASIIGLLGRIIVTFLLAAVVYRSRRRYLFLFSFGEALTFGIASTAVYLSYGSAEWLIRALILFTRTVTQICVLWFWWRNMLGQRHTARRDFYLALFVSVLAAIIDFYLISPYLCMLFV